MLPLVILTSFLVTLMLVPIVIRVFKSINLLDVPDRRKVHLVSTPSLGGIAIFSGVCLALLFSFPFLELAPHKYFIAASMMIFLLGIRDDLSSLLAKHKLLIQLFSGVLIIYFAEIKIEGLGGLLGLEQLPWHFDELFTLFVLVVMTNSYNLIDGIDGLAGSLGLILSLFFAWVFLSLGYSVDAGIAIAIAGGLLAFLLYNWFPSKIFMGDTGSMTIGFMLTVLLIKFVSLPNLTQLQIDYPASIAIALFVIPIYDTLRVFTIRLLRGEHPLAPDNNHVHHVLLKLRFNHAQATLTLASYTVITLFEAILLNQLGGLPVILILVIQTTLAGYFLDFRLKRQVIESAEVKERNLPSKVRLSKSA
jgi:UDP-N-acetylmuramyl pentapeptide phosphotransferase/UDP-N-acetylglucosamine-1-phosphate transferase